MRDDAAILPTRHPAFRGYSRFTGEAVVKKTSNRNADRSAQTTPLPLGLKMMGHAIVGEDYVADAMDAQLRTAFKVAAGALRKTDASIYGSMWTLALKIDRRSRTESRRKIADALDLSKLKVAKGATRKIIMDEAFFDAELTATESGFALGMATAFLLQQSLIGGTR